MQIGLFTRSNFFLTFETANEYIKRRQFKLFFFFITKKEKTSNFFLIFETTNEYIKRRQLKFFFWAESLTYTIENSWPHDKLF